MGFRRDLDAPSVGERSMSHHPTGQSLQEQDMHDAQLSDSIQEIAVTVFRSLPM